MDGLTKEIRHRIYKQAYKVYIDLEPMGMCWPLEIALFMVLKDWSYETAKENSSQDELSEYSPYLHLEVYPEIAKWEPEEHGIFWFPTTNRNIRKKIFKQAIIATE